MKCKTIKSKVENNCLFLFHGFGDNYENFMNFGVNMQLTQTTLISLKGPISYDLISCDSWYDMYDDEFMPISINYAQVDRIAIEIVDFILTISKRNIFLLGFGQGGTMALHCSGILKNKECGFGGICIDSGCISICGFPITKLHLPRHLITCSKQDLKENEKVIDGLNVVSFEKSAQVEMPKSRDEMSVIFKFLDEKLHLTNPALEEMCIEITPDMM